MRSDSKSRKLSLKRGAISSEGSSINPEDHMLRPTSSTFSKSLFDSSFGAKAGHEMARVGEYSELVGLMDDRSISSG